VKYTGYCLLPLLLLSLTCNEQSEQAPGEPQVASHVSQQQADEEPLLLLEDTSPIDDLPPPEGPVADNTRCHVCHINYAEETLAVMHARADIGCEQCHGSSDAHCGDEDNITPPDIMYPAHKINSSCMTCHPKQKIKVPQHEFVFDSIVANEKGCTECHGEHRLDHRTRRWNKTTGQLIQDDKVRMIETRISSPD
jgi:hypothetical protein